MKHVARKVSHQKDPEVSLSVVGVGARSALSNQDPGQRVSFTPMRNTREEVVYVQIEDPDWTYHENPGFTG